jgi:hypothetical protein
MARSQCTIESAASCQPDAAPDHGVTQIKAARKRPHLRNLLDQPRGRTEGKAVSELPRIETEKERLALLTEARLLGIDLEAISTSQPNGAKTLDWETLAQAVAEAQQP